MMSVAIIVVMRPAMSSVSLHRHPIVSRNPSAGLLLYPLMILRRRRTVGLSTYPTVCFIRLIKNVKCKVFSDP